MVAEIRLPPLGQTSDEMSVVEWYKDVGDSVQIAEPLLCVETDKANVDVESAEEGVLLQVIAQPGELLPSGSLLAYIGQPGELPPDEAPHSQPAAAPAEPVVTSERELPSLSAVPAASAARRPQAAPAVRRLAAALGVDLANVTATGPGGIIQRADVEHAAPAPLPAAPAPSDAPADPPPAQLAPPTTTTAEASAAQGAASEDLVPVSRVRRVIARRLTTSTQTIPAFRLTAHLDATAADRELAAYGKGLTYTHLLLRAVAVGLREHPVMRRLWVEDGPSYRVISEPHVGLAVAGEDALFVVTIPGPDLLPLPELVDTVAAAAARGRTGALTEQDQMPATITISNLGMFDVDEFDAIIDPNQNAILAVGSAKEQVVAHQGMFLIRRILSVTLTCDHRTVDGAQAARYLRTVREEFETRPGGGA